jgi:hypothetical protein
MGEPLVEFLSAKGLAFSKVLGHHGFHAELHMGDAVLEAFLKVVRPVTQHVESLVDAKGAVPGRSRQSNCPQQEVI